MRWAVSSQTPGRRAPQTLSAPVAATAWGRRGASSQATRPSVWGECLVALRGDPRFRFFRVRHAALKAATGTPARAYDGANADAHGAANAWDAGT
jgi:hypothetical protein